MKKIFILFVLLSSISLTTIKKPCFVLPILETDNRKTIHWGDERYLPNYRIPNGVHDYMVFFVPSGTEIKSFSDGTVLSTSFDSLRFGKTITIKHDSNIISFYGHVDTSFVSIGQKVKCGNIIGKTGITGKISGPILYFKVMQDSISIDPFDKIN